MKNLIIDKNFNIKTGSRVDKKYKIAKMNKSNTFSNYYFNLGFYLITPLLTGVFLGYYLDKNFGKKNFFVLTGIFLGLIGTLYNLYKIAKEK